MVIADLMIHHMPLKNLEKLTVQKPGQSRPGAQEIRNDQHRWIALLIC